MMHVCGACQKSFSSQRGLTQHRQRNNLCKRARAVEDINQIFKTAGDLISGMPAGLLPCLPIDTGEVGCNAVRGLPSDTVVLGEEEASWQKHCSLDERRKRKRADSRTGKCHGCCNLLFLSFATVAFLTLPFSASFLPTDCGRET